MPEQGLNFFTVKEEKNNPIVEEAESKGCLQKGSPGKKVQHRDRFKV